jgi:hypothetical protein
LANFSFLILKIEKIKTFTETKAKIKVIEAGRTAKEIPAPIEVNKIPKVKAFNDLYFLMITIKPALKIERPAATGISFELTCDIPTQIGKLEIKPKNIKAYLLDANVVYREILTIIIENSETSQVVMSMKYTLVSKDVSSKIDLLTT